MMSLTSKMLHNIPIPYLWNLKILSPLSLFLEELSFLVGSFMSFQWVKHVKMHI